MGIRKSTGQRSIPSNSPRSRTRRGMDKNQIPFTRIPPLKSVLSCFFFHSIFPKLNTVLFVVNTKLTLVASFQDLIQHRTAYRRAVQKTLMKQGEFCSYFNCPNVHCHDYHTVPLNDLLLYKKHLPILILHYKYDSGSSLKHHHTVKKNIYIEVGKYFTKS